MHKLRLAARPFGMVASLILFGMMIYVTCVIVLRQFFGIALLGVVDVMELSLVTLIFVAMPGVFFRDDNVTVDLIDQFLSRKARVVLRLAGLFLTLAFLLLTLNEMLIPAMDKLEDNDRTMTLGINRFIHWIPILFGFAVSIIATVTVLYFYIRYGVPRDPNLDSPEGSNQ
jgi:TRAP-type C4-dicarboxylate transport system permease small subunit